MKKLINTVEDVVSESLAGFCAAHADIVRMGETAPFVLRRQLTLGKVALLSGGGSGHEPLHSGFVGQGIIVKNYEGDVMNFDMAREMSGKSIATVITDDDVAMEKSTFSTGRRGVAGTLIVEKIVGAAAEQGRSFADLKALRWRSPSVSMASRVAAASS